MASIAQSSTFAMQNMMRNLWLSVMSVLMLVLTMLSITLVAGLNVMGSNVIQAVERKVDINFYFKERVDEKEILAAQGYLQSLSLVADVQYVSKEDALDELKARHVNDPAFLDSLKEITADILPASLTVRAKNISEYGMIIRAFEESEYGSLIENADYSDNQRIILRMSQVINRASQVGLAVSGMFVVVSMIVIFNMIRITIYAHREEIAIMKLVGATNWFIRSPFILESLVIGLIAAAITVLVTTISVWIANPTLSSFFAGYDFAPWPFLVEHAIIVVALEVVIACFLTISSSMVAMTRYLKI